MKKVKKKYISITKKMKNNVFLSVLPVAIVVLSVSIIYTNVFKALKVTTVIMAVPFIIKYGGNIMSKKKNNKKIKNTKKVNDTKKVKKTKKGKKILNIILSSILILTTITILVGFGFIGYIVKSAPVFDPDNLYRKEASVIYAADGEIIARLGRERRDKITYQDMPQVLIDAIIATEDARFYQHNGLDLPRFMRASMGQILGNTSAGGASTLTMQVVKNHFTSTEQNLVRKFTDIYMSIFKLERKYSKEQILEFYVNSPYLGSGAYGVAEAARTYFGKEVENLNLAEASLIAGLFQAPSFFDPHLHPERAEKRRSTVLYLMRRHGFITEEQEQIANSMSVESLLTTRSDTRNKYQPFIDTVVSEAEQKTGHSPYNVSMAIHTTLDTKKQEYINEVLDGDLFNWVNDVVQSGIAVTDTQNGAVLAIGGGRNLQGERVFNFATMLNKQPGSTAKPIYDYAPGIEFLNWSTYTPFIDEPHSYTNGNKIRNWDGRFMGFLTLKESLGLSRNTPALKAFQQVDNKDILELVTNLGMTPEIENGRIHEAHSLGAYTGSNPLQMAAAYAAFANGGYFIEPYTITKIRFIETNETKEYQPTRVKAMEDSTAYLVTNSLLWATNHGLSSGARLSGYQVAAKTGTTNFDAQTVRAYGLPRDAINDQWVIGYSQDYSIGLWYGYDKIDRNYVSVLNDAIRRDRLFNTIVKGIIPGSTRSFTRPNSVVAVEVERYSAPAMLPNEFTPKHMRLTEFFKRGTEPTQVSERYKKLPNVTQLNVVNKNEKVEINWNKIETPRYYTDEHIKNTVGQNLSTKYVETFKNKLDEEMGILGYDIYIKDSTDNITLLGRTENNSFTVDRPNISGNITFIVKTAFSNFKANTSSGSEFTFTNDIITAPDFIINFNDVCLNNTFRQPNYTDITVIDGGVPVTNEIDVIGITITKRPTNTTVEWNNIDTSEKNTYDITYTIKYKNQTYTAKKEVRVKECN